MNNQILTIIQKNLDNLGLVTIEDIQKINPNFTKEFIIESFINYLISNFPVMDIICYTVIKLDNKIVCSYSSFSQLNSERKRNTLSPVEVNIIGLYLKKMTLQQVKALLSNQPTIKKNEFFLSKNNNAEIIKKSKSIQTITSKNQNNPSKKITTINNKMDIQNNEKSKKTELLRKPSTKQLNSKIQLKNKESKQSKKVLQIQQCSESQQYYDCQKKQSFNKFFQNNAGKQTSPVSTKMQLQKQQKIQQQPQEQDIQILLGKMNKKIEEKKNDEKISKVPENKKNPKKPNNSDAKNGNLLSFIIAKK